MKKLPRTYFTTPNGIKIDMRCGFGSLYPLKQIRTDVAKVFQDKELLNVSLTDELRNKGSLEVTLNYDEFKEILRSIKDDR